MQLARVGLLIMTMISTFFVSKAQEVFSEGIIIYAVSIGNVSGTQGFTDHAGTYTITLKGKLIRKELKMNNGYQNIILHNRTSGTTYSLQSTGGQLYAVQLDAKDVLDKQRPYERYSIRKEEGLSTIAGQQCQKAKITYKDGSISEAYLSTKWTTSDSAIYDRYPGIVALPLSFEYRNEDGIVMHFNAEKVVANPVENAVFRIPASYKMITNQEYKMLKR